eukprot:jgi/Mesvir1/24729/Mv21994-RA.1
MGVETMLAAVTSIPWNDLSDFELQEILSDNGKGKAIFMLGRFSGKEGRAVVKMERQHFPKDLLPAFFSAQMPLSRTFVNDVYDQYKGMATGDLAAVNVEVIFPATDRHISKLREQKSFLVLETPDVYCDVTLPYISSFPPSGIQWVYNMLDRKAEVERLIFEDPDRDVGFMVHPDMKWDQSELDSLYCLAICHRRDIRSLRDLTAEHLPLLKNIQAKGTAALRDKFGIRQDQLRVFIHYMPSYFHLHVHFMAMGRDGGYGMAVGKSYLLADVIENIEMYGSDFYKKKTLSVSLSEQDELLAKIRQYNATDGGR